MGSSVKISHVGDDRARGCRFDLGRRRSAACLVSGGNFDLSQRATARAPGPTGEYLAHRWINRIERSSSVGLDWSGNRFSPESLSCRCSAVRVLPSLPPDSASAGQMPAGKPCPIRNPRCRVNSLRGDYLSPPLARGRLPGRAGTETQLSRPVSECSVSSSAQRAGCAFHR